MQFVEPQVYVIAKTSVDQYVLQQYLTDIGAEKFTSDAKSDGDLLSEVAGRLCYNSFVPGLNPNVTKIREGNRPYLRNILAQNHGSVLEHTSITFLFHNVSRVFTHELVRHRVGTAISQESLRYVCLTDMKFYRPEGLDVCQASLWRGLLQKVQDFYTERSETFRDKTFALKKQLTSALRRILPMGMCTTILWTSNLRNLRHVILQRTAKGAEEEIRKVFDIVAHECQKLYPNVFQDFVRSPGGVWGVDQEEACNPGAVSFATK